MGQAVQRAMRFGCACQEIERVAFVPFRQPSEHDHLVVSREAQVSRVNRALRSKEDMIKLVVGVKTRCKESTLIAHMSILVKMREGTRRSNVPKAEEKNEC